MVSDDDYHALVAPLSHDPKGTEVNEQSVLLSYYRSEEVLMSVEHMAGPAVPLRDI